MVAATVVERRIKARAVRADSSSFISSGRWVFFSFIKRTENPAFSVFPAQILAVRILKHVALRME
jgi:hypothetical protein